MQYRLYLGVPSPSTREAGVSRRAARGPSKLSSQRVENSQKKAKKDSRQSLPGLLGLVDVTFVQGALVASCLTQSLMELELDDEADKVPGGEGGVTLSPGCPPPSHCSQDVRMSPPQLPESSRPPPTPPTSQEGLCRGALGGHT